MHLEDSLSSYVRAHYDVAYMGEGLDPDHLEAAQEFLLADVHTALAFSVINTDFINRYSREGDIVLLESVSLGCPPESHQQVHAIWIDRKDMLRGWDIGGSDVISGQPLARRVGEHESLAQILIQKVVSAPTEADREAHMAELCEIVYRQCTDIEVTSEEFIHKAAAGLDATFDARNLSMITALSAEKPPKSRSFLIAGISHLVNHDKVEEVLRTFNSSIEEWTRRDLSSFDTFLRGRKVVILIPKASSAPPLFSKIANVMDTCIKRIEKDIPRAVMDRLVLTFPGFGKLRHPQISMQNVLLRVFSLFEEELLHPEFPEGSLDRFTIQLDALITTINTAVGIDSADAKQIAERKELEKAIELLKSKLEEIIGLNPDLNIRKMMIQAIKSLMQLTLEIIFDDEEDGASSDDLPCSNIIHATIIETGKAAGLSEEEAKRRAQLTKDLLEAVSELLLREEFTVWTLEEMKAIHKASAETLTRKALSAEEAAAIDVAISQHYRHLIGASLNDRKKMARMMG